MGYLTKVIKYLAVLFNLLIVICAIVLIVLGVVILKSQSIGTSIGTVKLTHFSFAVGASAIAVGAFVFVVAFFGCYGSIKENRCMLVTHAIVLMILLFLQVVLGTMAFLSVKKHGAEALTENVGEIFEALFKNYNQHEGDTIMIKQLQENMGCCGVDGPKYWDAKNVTNFPTSCCTGNLDSCTATVNSFRKGCKQRLKELIEGNVKVIAIVALSFAVLEFVRAIFAGVLGRKQKATAQISASGL